MLGTETLGLVAYSAVSLPAGVARGSEWREDPAWSPPLYVGERRRLITGVKSQFEGGGFDEGIDRDLDQTEPCCFGDNAVEVAR